MIKKIIIICFVTMSLVGCTKLSEINEKAKGDGVPYIPGI